MTRRRIWSELLPPEELGAPSTIALLESFGLEPIVALPPSAETPAMHTALARLAASKLRVGLWPLLDDAEGYWPSRDNFEHFEARVNAALAFAARAGLDVRTVAFDLEPPLQVVRRYDEGTIVDRGRLFVESAFGAARRAGREAERAAAISFAALAARLEAQGIETLAAIVPMVLADLAWGAPLWQAVLHTPVVGASWAVISPMLYSSIIAAELPLESLVSARALLYEGARVLVERAGASRASVSIGLVGTGKLGHEPVLPDPSALALDVGAARAAGVDDLALFSLDGVLRGGRPEAWLEAFVRAEPRAPDGITSRLVSALVRGGVWASRPLAHLGRDP